MFEHFGEIDKEKRTKARRRRERESARRNSQDV
jgi:hypothetical protein